MAITQTDIKLLYQPKEDKTMNIVVLGSGSGTNLEAILKAQTTNPLFKVKAIFCDRKCRFQEIGIDAGLPVIYHSFANFFKSKGLNPQDYNTRCQYDQEIAHLLQQCAHVNHFNIDIVVLAGYMRLLFAPMLNVFKNQIINVHPADLTKLDESGQRIYVGTNSVHDALSKGEKRTRSCVLLVNERMDSGPMITSGPWVNYQEGYPLSEEKSKLHQQKQKTSSDWPALVESILLLSQGRIGIDENNHIYVDGKQQPKDGWALD